MVRRSRAIRSINAAIRELREAKRFVRLHRLELAEDELADSLKDIAKAIRAINRKELLRG
ncbi:MAG: hypothetical protein K6T30_08245 [Alicyclobacillus sp.]|nr:hypothetical protein [Alicyclobacillus sp.]